MLDFTAEDARSVRDSFREKAYGEALRTLAGLDLSDGITDSTGVELLAKMLSSAKIKGAMVLEVKAAWREEMKKIRVQNSETFVNNAKRCIVWLNTILKVLGLPAR